jgi:hypothetical protein
MYFAKVAPGDSRIDQVQVTSPKNAANARYQFSIELGIFYWGEYNYESPVRRKFYSVYRVIN